MYFAQNGIYQGGHSSPLSHFDQNSNNPLATASFTEPTSERDRYIQMLVK